MIVTIDGPAGSGKSTAARELAAKLHVAYVDTGAMYRAVTLGALDTGVDLENAEALGRLAHACHIRLDNSPEQPKVFLEGREVTEAIRSMRVNEATARVAGVPAIRAVLVAKQREIAAVAGSLVADGRDQGSVVFPHADYKFLLSASIEKRALRRFQEMSAAANPDTLRYEDVLSNLRRRDATDSIQWAPLEASRYTIKIDTTDMTVDETVGRMLEVIQSDSVPCTGS